MNCPTCKYPNPQGVTYCQMCYEVFNRSAADRYLHAQKRARMKEGYVPEGAAPITRVITKTLNLPSVDLAGAARRVFEKVRVAVLPFKKEIGLSAGIIALGVLVVYFSSPTQRMQIFGSRLTYVFSTQQPTPYLVTMHTEIKSWSERGGRLDTPLETYQKDEMGNVLLSAKKDQKTQIIEIRAREWIVDQDGRVSQNLALTHPTLKISDKLLDRRGRLIKDKINYAARTGRVFNFLVPRLPDGAKRVGSRWQEPVEWVQAIGDWKILWKGRLNWTITGFETEKYLPCVHLAYQPEVTPFLWDAPAWAHGVVKQVRFAGEWKGEAMFDPGKRQIYANQLSQEGTLTLPIADIYRIPEELRVGRMPRHRFGRRPDGEPGTIVIQIKDKLDAHKS
jgi:hypothetical protein